MERNSKHTTPPSSKPDAESLLLIVAVILLFGSMIIHFSMRSWLVLLVVGFVFVSWYSHLK